MFFFTLASMFHEKAKGQIKASGMLKKKLSEKT